MLSDTFRPKKVTEIIGHKKQIKQIQKWLKNWRNEKSKALLFYGPPGIGKTTCAHVLCKGYEIIETNASNKRSAGAIQGLFVTVKSRSLFNKNGKVLIMDEVDGMSAGDRGGVAEIRKLIECTRCPIICIANDIIGPKLAPLRKVAEKIEFVPPSPKELIRYFGEISKIPKKRLKRIVMSSGGDIRNIFNTIQAGMKTCSKDGFQDIDVADAVKYLINEKRLTYEQKTTLFYSDYSMIPLYIQNLYPSYIRNVQDLAEAADNMSLADVCGEQTMKNQQWEFLRYVEHLTVNTAQKGGEYSSRFVQFPQFLPKISKMNKYKRIMQRTGLDQDSLSVMYLKYFSKIVKNNIDDNELEAIVQMYDKDDIYDLIEHFYQEKVPTKMKRKITSIYKKNNTIVCTVKEKGKRKKKIEIALGGGGSKN